MKDAELKKFIEKTVQDALKSLTLTADFKNVEEVKPLAELENGAHFWYKGTEFIRLGEEQGGILAMTAKTYPETAFSKDGSNDYRRSDLRKAVLKTFDEIGIDENDVLPFTMDLISDDGDRDYGTVTDKIGILNCDLRRKYKKEIGYPRDNWEWTCTPWYITSGYAYSVRSVYPSGGLGSHHAYYGRGFAPACIFKSDVSAATSRRDG